MKLIKIATAAVAAVALSGGLLATTAATAATGHPRLAGPEMISGTSTSVTSSTVPLLARGAFRDTGSINLNGGGTKGSLRLSRGNLLVTHSKGIATQRFSKANCQFVQTTRGSYVITGGTGRYAGARGHGLYYAVFEAVFPRKANGKCNESSKAVPTSAVTVFNVAGPVRVP